MNKVSGYVLSVSWTPGAISAMMYVSDDENEPPRSGQLVATKLQKLLRRDCTCQRGICFKQFQDCPNVVQTKRDEFRALQPLEKATLLS